MSNDNFYVKQSELHGMGLFASREIKRGETIGVIKYNPTNKDGPHVLWVDNQGILVESDLKYINHDGNPNACYCEDLQVVALRNINRDEEITHDYGDDWK